MRPSWGKSTWAGASHPDWPAYSRVRSAGQPLGLAGPIEERAAQAPEVLDRLVERANRGTDGPVGGAQLAGLAEDLRRREGGCLGDEPQKPLTDLSGRLLPVPFELWRER